MNSFGQIFTTSVTQALQELRVNKLRTFLSLLGITIGIFCIIAVLTALDSMKDNIHKEVSTLGSDEIYINRWPWTDDGGEYKWWEYWRRPSMSLAEIRAVETQMPDAEYASLVLPISNMTVKRGDFDISNITGYAVTNNFDKVQNIEVQSGRYLSPAEIGAGIYTVVLGNDVYDQLFQGNSDVTGKTVTFLGRKFYVAGFLKKIGQNMAGFDFDNSVIFPYYAAANLVDLRSLEYNPNLIIKAAPGKNVDDVRYEAEGLLRRVRKVKPGAGDDFAMNQLSQISQKLDMLFSSIDFIGVIIGGFSLLVGSFGIANIMFVTVKERTKIIGLKKAIGAKPNSILMEFLVEAVTLCIIGGLIGITIVLLLSFVLTYGFHYNVILSLQNFFLGVGISAVVGVLAGIIPARAASRLDPVVAIRSN
ncbi:MAG: ABC transporter permease [Flavipsychrobacter sp.]|nr:ABC transporter permease [Flavipsychrobacter sp.]